MRPTRSFLIPFLAVAISLSLSGPAGAQGSGAPVELSVGSGWGRLWDDETDLGRGAPVSASIAATFARHVRLSADVDWMRHVRDSGYLRAEGDLIGVFGRAAYVFGGEPASVRPVVGVGLGLMRSSGVLISRSVVAGTQGLPIHGPDSRTTWAATQGAFHVHGGLRIRLSARLALRPEGQIRMTTGSGTSRGIEPPLWLTQTMVSLDWRID